MQVDHVILIPVDVVRLLETVVASFHDTLSQIQDQTGPLLWFPDGSLQAGASDVVRPYWARCLPREVGDLVSSYTFFSSLPSFPRRTHSMLVSAKYQRRLMGFTFGVMPIKWERDSSPASLDLSNLTVTAAFVRPLRQTQAASLRDTLVDWSRCLGGRGILRDGPVRLISAGINVHDRRAQFVVDANLGGQDTLNWLVLTLLSFGIKVFPIFGVVFDDVARLDRYTGIAGGEPFFVPFEPPS
jgi:hypothetical protein